MSTEFKRSASGSAWHFLARSAGRFFFPSLCLCCGRAAPRSLQGGVCAACWMLAAPSAGPRCDRCGQHVVWADPGRCGRCLLFPPEFRTLQALTSYRATARAILLAFKFRGADYLAPHLARRMAAGLELPDGIDEVVPVPAVARQRLRRDHAAELLAAAVASELAIPLASNRVVKVRTTLRQSSLPLARRAENVRGAFQARRPVPRRILLVDDVATSCATARACARELLRGGAATVDVWCYARATREDELADGD